MTMPPIPLLETRRLWLRPYRLADAPAVQRRFSRWEVIEFLGAQVPWPYPDDGAQSFLQIAEADNASGAKNHWGIWLKGGPDEVIGAISLWPDDGISHDMRGFWLDPDFQGRGLMTEAADRVTDYALTELGWPRLWLGNAKANVRSAAVKQRQGAVLVGEEMRNFVSGRLPRQVWLLDHTTWLARSKP
jgi:RimJ/RimL family protein N-acetyltransferase